MSKQDQEQEMRGICIHSLLRLPGVAIKGGSAATPSDVGAKQGKGDKRKDRSYG